MYFKSSILTLGFLALPAVASADSYLLTAENPYPVGLQTKVTTTTKISMVAEMGEGMQIANNIDGKKVLELKVTAANSVTLNIPQDGMTMSMNMPGMGPQKQNQDSPLSGKTLTGTLEGGKWVFKAKGEEVDGVALKGLQKSFNEKTKTEKAFFGNEKRSVGDTWDFNPGEAGGFGELDDLEGTGKATFVAVEEKGGAQCAKITLKFDAKSTNAQGGVGEVSLKGEMTVWRDLKLKVNRRTEFKGTMSGDIMPKPAPMEMTEITEVIAAP